MTGNPVRIGVLALQGDFREHLHVMTMLGAEATTVRREAELAEVDGLIIPGGESSVMDKLSRAFGLADPVKAAIAEGLPADFGFPVVVHPHRPETVYVFPLVADGARIPPEGRARVWRSADAGSTWEASSSGLPDGFYAAVMRDAMCVDDHDPAGVYFGARNGSVWASADEGDTWRQIVSNLPDVMVVRAASI